MITPTDYNTSTNTSLSSSHDESVVLILIKQVLFNPKGNIFIVNLTQLDFVISQSQPLQPYCKLLNNKIQKHCVK